MYCPNCGHQALSNEVYCAECGNLLERGSVRPVNSQKTSKGPWDVFANLSFAFGIASLVGAIFFFGSLAIPGIVFGALSMNKDIPGKGRAKAGMIMSIIALAILVLYIVLLIAAPFFSIHWILNRY